ncbi:unnamed protein product [Brachionus calyciflorus]|uniref:CobW/HypB/UreG nucleotide-binding domain-containing protein n=1 Tax=Brachionus calyciflorus TaxID=104777 RepID=A0A813MVX7_9BILA|nr:unnamed protein product [Brachionus calyciflorus]
MLHLISKNLTVNDKKYTKIESFSRVDASFLKNGQAMLKRTEEKLVELANGCICCTLRGDLIKEISKLAKKNKFDYLLIESTGMAEPLAIAKAFSVEDDNRKTLYEVIKKKFKEIKKRLLWTKKK